MVGLFQSQLASHRGGVVSNPVFQQTFGTTSFAFSAGLVETEDFTIRPEPPRNGILGPPESPVSLLQIRDGTSNTLLAGTASINPRQPACQDGHCLGWWIGRPSYAAELTYLDTDTVRWVELRKRPGEEPQANYRADDAPADDTTPARPRGFGGGHPGGGLFVFADVRARQINEAIDPEILAALATRSGRELISSDDF